MGAPRRTPAEIFADHRAKPYAVLARATADVLPSDLTGVLVALATVRGAAFQGLATDPWVASAEQFRTDLAGLAAEVEAARAVGRVQFTEPLRITDVLPGLLLAARRYPGRPLRLVELGACAGLLLAPEVYRIDYRCSSWQPPGARTTLHCDAEVPAHLLHTPLVIVDRLGLDLAPVDPRDPDAYDYLRTFCWAGDPTRETRLRDALAAVAHDPPPVIATDVVEALPDVLAERVGPEAVTVVVESGLSTYLRGGHLLRLGRTLDAHANQGPLVLLTRAGAAPGIEDLTNSIKVVDLHRPWRSTYAAGDLLTERVRWIGPVAAETGPSATRRSTSQSIRVGTDSRQCRQLK